MPNGNQARDRAPKKKNVPLRASTIETGDDASFSISIHTKRPRVMN